MCLWCSAAKLNVSVLGTFPHGAWSDLCSFCHYLNSHLSYSISLVFHSFSMSLCVNCEKKKKQLLSAYWYVQNKYLSLIDIGVMWESGCCFTVFIFQIMTAGTTATRRAVVTPAPALSSNVTAAAASRITGPVTETMTAGTTATRPMQTAPTRVSVWTCPPAAVCYIQS